MSKIETTGERIKAAREEMGISRYRLSKISGIPESTISLAESGMCLPSSGTLKKICPALGVSADHILGID